MQQMKSIEQIKSQANVAGESLRAGKELQLFGTMQAAARVDFGCMR
jgi:hypothetical protein